MGQSLPHLAILGGGPAGLGLSFYANRLGLPFVLFEGAPHLGGLCRTLQCGQHSYDLGAHRFHDRLSDITHDVKQLLGNRLSPVTAPSQIYSGGQLFDFPPTPLNSLFSSGLRKVGRIEFDLIKAHLRPRPVRSFADFAVNTFGETLARKFLLNYSEKVWGIPADQLSADIATRRLSGMTLSSLLVETIFPSKKAAHIDGSFLYPRGGYGEISRALAKSLPSSSVETNHTVTEIECEDSRVKRIHFKSEPPFQLSGTVVSTLPLTTTVSLLSCPLSTQVRQACGSLRFRNIRLIFLRLARQQISHNASIYFPDSSYCFSRIYEPKNRSAVMAPRGETSIVAEVPCSANDSVARLSPEALCERVVAGLSETGLLDSGQLIEWRHHFLANAYPVYSRDYSSKVQMVLKALETITNLHMLGRSGLFFYSHLHDQLGLGKEFAEKISGRKVQVPAKSVGGSDNSGRRRCC